MKRALILIGIFFTISLPVEAQQGNAVIRLFSGVPAGACNRAHIAVDTSTGDFYSCNGGTWLKVGPGAAGAVTWNSVTNPDGNQALTMAAHTTIFTWNATTGAGVDMFSLLDTTGNTGTGYILSVSTTGTSAAKAVRFTDGGTANGVELNTSGVFQAIGTGSVLADNLTANAIGATTDFDPAICAASEILERQGAVWACITTPGGGGGLTHTVNGLALASATAIDFDDALPAAPASSVNLNWQKDALDPTNVSISLLLTDIDGVGIGVSGTELILDNSELTANQTFWTGASASRTISYSLSGANDPVVTLADGVFNLTTGTLQQNGDDVIHKDTNTLLSTENVILDGSTNPRDITLGIIRILQTPNMDSTRGIAIITDAAGFGDTKALEVDWTATGVAAGDFEAVIDLDIDTANSSGGNIIGLEITGTDTGSAAMYGMLTGVGVNPILNEAGVFGNVETAFTFDSVFTDVTADFNSSASDVQMFVSNGDLVYIGMAALFDEVEFILAVTASNAGIQPTFEYSDGASGWITFSPTDNTNGMRQNGDLVWIATSLAGWAQDTVNAVSGKFWIRITRGAVTVSTPPTEDLVQVNEDLDFIWDSSGNLNVASISSGFNQEIADAGFIRCANAEICMAWELATPGVDKTLIVDASDILQFNGTFNATAVTSGANAVETTNNKDAANGYAGLDANSNILLAAVPDGTANQILGTDAAGTAAEHKSLATGTSGTDFAIVHTAGVVTYDLPVASGTNTGKLSNTDWTTFDGSVDSVTGGNGIASSGGETPAITFDPLIVQDGTGVAFSFSGLEFAGAGSDKVALLQGCADTEILKWDDESGGLGRWDCAADVSGGSPAWDSLTDPTGAVTMNSNTNAELVSFLYTSALGATDVAFTIEQLTGNTLAGSILLEITAADTDILLLSAGAGANTIDITQAGAMTAEGTASITATLGDSATGFFTAGEIEKLHLPDVEGLDTALTANRCVRVNAGGTAVEAAAADCNSGAGANTALSNLAAVAINLPLLPDVAAADDFGSATLPFKDLFLAGSSGTPGTNNFRITGASTSGTRVFTLADAASNSVIPDAGSANNFLTAIAATGVISKAQPAFTDISGTATAGQVPNLESLNGTLDIASGGTGQTAREAAYDALSPNTTEGDLTFRNATVNTRLARGSDGQCLTSNTTTIVWGSCGGSNVDLLDGSVHQDTLAGTVVLGDIVHGNVTPAWARLAGNITTTKQFLTQTGSGAASAVPVWGVIATGDIQELIALADLTDVASTTGTGTASVLSGNPTLAGATINGANLLLDDGVGDTPQVILSPATGTIWQFFVDDTSDDFQMGVSTTSPEDFDFINNGTGLMVVNIETADGVLTDIKDTAVHTTGTLAAVRGGTNLDTSGSTGISRVDTGTWSVSELSGDIATSGSNVTSYNVQAASGVDGVIELDNALAGSSTDVELAAGVAGTGITLNTGTTPDSLDCDAASTTAVGCPEMAVSSEVDTGTSTILAVTPDALAGSVHGQVEVQMVAFDFTTAVATGDGAYYFHIATGSKLIGMNLIDIVGAVITVSSSGAITVDLARCAPVATGTPCSGTVADVLSTNLTIDQNEDSSDTAAAASVIDTANDDVIVDQTWRVDVDGAGTSTEGLLVTLIFKFP